MTLTCAYYRNRFDGSLWVLRANGTRVVDAVGPLPPHVVASTVPMEHKAGRPVDVAGWSTLSFEQVGTPWELHSRHRIHPGKVKADLQEYRGEFELKIVPA